MRVIVVGGGPAGILAAISAAESCDEVILLEKMNSLGKKLLITGKGRCNITSSLNVSEFVQNIPGNGRFLFSSFQNYTNTDIINLLKEEGLEVKEERGNRIFPVTDRAEDVLKAFSKRLKKNNIEVKYNKKVVDILVEENKIKEVVYMDTKTEQKETLQCEKVILATGGKSYPITGSTGEGHILAQKLGHNIIKLKPSLVPLESYEKNLCQNMQGLSLKNVGIKIMDKSNNKAIYEDFGEMLFTHFGVSGPTILSSSAHLLRYKNVEQLLQDEKVELLIDLKPALVEEKLDTRILRDFEEEKNKSFKNSLDKLLPKKMIEQFVFLVKIDPEKKVNEITKEERKKIVELMKKFTIKISGFRKIEEAIITSGGVDTKEIDPKTMESKLIKGLFFAGEIIDVDGYTGGFNLQIAYSTGYVAGRNK